MSLPSNLAFDRGPDVLDQLQGAEHIMPLQLIDLIGFAAAAMVFLTFCMQTLLPLRLVATGSNILFIAYAGSAGLAPILILHALLLPVNLWGIMRQLRLRRRLQNTLSQHPETSRLIPFMTQQTFSDGTAIFNEGDSADRLYVVVDGEVSVDSFDKLIGKGEIFGEIGLFSAQGQRTATVRAVGPVTVAWINRQMLIKVFQDHPDFALALTKLIVTRVTENQNTLKLQLLSQSS